MKYIVWELISPYDGYGTNEYATWEEARKRVMEVMTASHMRYTPKARKQYKDWLAGKIGKIYVSSGEGQQQSVEVEIFITSTPLTGPLS